MTGAFRLPALSTDQPPAISSLAACREWLVALPLANPAQAQALLLAQVNLLNRYAVAAAQRLQILELLRESLVFVQSECAKKFMGRPLPLVAAEQAAFDANRSLWQALSTGYQHCLETCLEGEPGIGAQAALICHRALAALGAEQFDLYRAPHETGPAFWRRVFAIYSAAAELGAAEADVIDPLLSRRSPTTPRAAFVQLLLMHAASPYELSLRNIGFTYRWLQGWSRKVPVSGSAPANPKLPPLVVDLAGDRPATIRPEEAGNLRWLATEQLARSLKKRIAALGKGAKPAALGLGDDVPPGIETLLRHLYERCCKGLIVRQQVRRPSTGMCRLVAGGEAIHYYVSGKPFQPPAAVTSLSRRQHEEIATLGQVATHHDEGAHRQLGFVIEDWRIADENSAGYRLQRPADETVLRLGFGCLVGVQPPDGMAIVLAVMRWAMVGQDGVLSVGVRLIPGVPEPVALRPVGLAPTEVKYRQGFLVPAVPSLNQPATVVTPGGWYRQGRIVEVYTQGTQGLQELRMTRVIEQGPDFERAEYQAL